MGVAVEAAFGAALDAANAGKTLGPRAVVNAVSNASIFLGAANVFTLLNIFLLRPAVAYIEGVVAGEWQG
jgi:hypothetical protein